MSYILVCPKCNAEHDLTGQIDIWRNEFLLEIEGLVQELKQREKDKIKGD